MSVLDPTTSVMEEMKCLLRRHLRNVNFGPGDPSPLVNGSIRPPLLVIIEDKGRSAVVRLVRSKPTEIANVSYARRCLILDDNIVSEPVLRAGIWEPTGVAQPFAYSELIKTGADSEPSPILISAAKWADWLDPEKDVRSLH